MTRRGDCQLSVRLKMHIQSKLLYRTCQSWAGVGKNGTGKNGTRKNDTGINGTRKKWHPEEMALCKFGKNGTSRKNVSLFS